MVTCEIGLAKEWRNKLGKPNRKVAMRLFIDYLISLRASDERCSSTGYEHLQLNGAQYFGRNWFRNEFDGDVNLMNITNLFYVDCVVVLAI